MPVSGEMVASFAARDPSPWLFHSLTSFFVFSGVYFTSLDPNRDPKELLYNNYDDRGQVGRSKRLWAKLDWVVEVEMDVNEVEKAETPPNRDVYLYKGNVNLKNYQYRIYKNTNTKDKDWATLFFFSFKETVRNLATGINKFRELFSFKIVISWYRKCSWFLAISVLKGITQNGGYKHQKQQTHCITDFYNIELDVWYAATYIFRSDR